MRSNKTCVPQLTDGFSLVEVLIAMALLTVVLLSLVPLFQRSMVVNANGREAGQQSALGRSEVEELLQLPFNHDLLEVAAGTERTFTEYWSTGLPERLGDEGWRPDPPTPGAGLGEQEEALWQRTVRVHQYSLNGVEDSDGDGVIDRILGLEDADRDGVFDNPLPAGALAASVHLKEVEVTVDSRRGAGNPVPRASRLRLQQLKSF
jgi:prepilin-type N-terminal cleavage/methylation domain-containing protein